MQSAVQSQANYSETDFRRVVFLKFIVSKFSASCKKVEVVFDRYSDNSIKGENEHNVKGLGRVELTRGDNAKFLPASYSRVSL